MKKCLFIIIPVLLSGCPMGDKINRHPAQSKIMNGKVCIFVDQKDIVKNENILRVQIWKVGGEDYVYEKSYAASPVPLEAGKCIPEIDEFDFVPGTDYTVTVQTPLNPYETEVKLER